MSPEEEWENFCTKVATTNILVTDDYTDTFYFYNLDGEFECEVPRAAIDAMDAAHYNAEKIREEAHKEDNNNWIYVIDD